MWTWQSKSRGAAPMALGGQHIAASFKNAEDRREKQTIFRRSFPYSIPRYDSLAYAAIASNTSNAADYSLATTVAHTSIYVNPEARYLAIGFKRDDDGERQPRTAKECAPAPRARIDARSLWRWTRPAAGGDGSPTRPSCRAGGVRAGTEGTPHDALLKPQEAAL